DGALPRAACLPVHFSERRLASNKPLDRGTFMGILDLGRYKGIVFAITGFLVFIAIILAVNHGKAGQFADDVAAVKFLAQQQAQPAVVHSAGLTLARTLRERQNIDEP